MAEKPFVEKYRPEALEDLAGNGNIRALKAFAKTGQFPLAMVFHGGYGTGKTTAARAVVRDYYVLNGLFLPVATFRDIRSGANAAAGYEGLFPPVLYVDATLTRDIDFIKETVQMFMKTFSPKGLKKFIVIDEADRLSRDAQGALRSLLEKYPNTVTIYTTNSLHAIDQAIVSRAAGAVFEFLKPSVEEVVLYLKKLAAKEYAEIPDEKLRQISVESESLREAVGKVGTEVAIFRAEHAPTAGVEVRPQPALVVASSPAVTEATREATAQMKKALEEFALLQKVPPESREKVMREEERKPLTLPAEELEKEEQILQEEPEQTVYVQILISGGVELKEDGKTPKIQVPEFYAECTTSEEYAKHGNKWEEGMWDAFRHVLHEGEVTLNKLTDNRLPGENRGLETFNAKEAQKILQTFEPAKANQIYNVLTEALRLHKGFYEWYSYGDLEEKEAKPLTDPSHKSDESARAIVSMAKWLKIPLEHVEPLSSLPLGKEGIWNHVWTVIEHWSPENISVPGAEKGLEALVEEAVGELEGVGESALRELEGL